MPRSNETTFPSSERGVANGVFVVTLLLLLGAVFLWWSATEETDTALQAQAEAQQARADMQRAGSELARRYRDLSQTVGFLSGSYSESKFLVDGVPASFPETSLAELKAHVTKDGKVARDGAESPGTLAYLLANASMVFTQKGRLHGQKEIGAESTYEYSASAAAFAQKMADFQEEWAQKLGERPSPPADWDDASAQAAYEEALKAFESTTREYATALESLLAEEGAKEWKDVVRAPGEWTDETAKVTVNYFQYPAGGQPTVEELLRGIPTMVEAYEKELDATATTAAQTIQRLEGEKQTSVSAAETSNQALVAERQAFEDDRRTLQERVGELERQVEQTNTDKTEAQNLLAEVREEKARELRQVSSERDAYREGLAGAKERRDLAIRRDQVKGLILAASSTLQTATINLGSADRAFVGLRFRVSELGQGGVRIDKADVIVTEVTGRHSSNVRVLSRTAPLQTGDRLHNPLYDPTARIRVYVHGTLDKWPKELARTRLAALNAVLQDEVNGETDYVVIPNSMAVKPAAPAEGEEEEEAEESEGPPATSALDEILSIARRFGAQVVTERLFDEFLDY